MEEKEKISAKLKLAASLRKIINENKKISSQNQENGIEDVTLIDGIRQLEASSRLSYTIVQGVFAGQRDLQFTTLLSLIEDGLGITLTEFAKIYDSIVEGDIKMTKKEIADSKRGKLSGRVRKKQSTAKLPKGK